MNLTFVYNAFLYWKIHYSEENICYKKTIYIVIRMSASYKILGVDPGTNITGYAIIEVNGKSTKVVTYGVFKLTKFEDHQTKLKEIFLQLQDVIESYLPEELAIEAPFHGKNVQSMLKLGRAQGVAMAAAMTMGLKIFEYSPKKIKLAVTGSGNASKEQVHAMLENRMKIKIDQKYLDASDALATAICHFQQRGQVKISKNSYKDWSSFIKANPDRKI